MFKFDFDIEDLDEEHAGPSSSSTLAGPSDLQTHTILEPFSEILLLQLLDDLPSLISYSPLSIPLASGETLNLARRDLFDARFQLISEGRGEEDGDQAKDMKLDPLASALDFLHTPSDLVPGVYEGGLKTWECSLDLVNYLEGLKGTSSYRGILGKRSLEIGCGTAVPSLYLLHDIFSSEPQPESRERQTQVHVQDYNSSVLQLVTLPNILLTWYMSPSSLSYRSSRNEIDTDETTLPPSDPSSAGELPVTPELKSAFLSSLEAHGLTLRFFSGSWNTFDLNLSGGKYDLVLTSETIYRPESLGALTSLMQAACGCGDSKDVPLDQLTSSLSLTSPSPSLRPYLCLVAAKILYFGVGGGVSDFIRFIQESDEGPDVSGRRKRRVETVWERKVGVGRKILSVEWL